MDLTSKKCVPCETGEGKLTKELVNQFLPAVTGWELNDEKIEKSFKFKDFKDGINFVNKVADLAESEGHHPDFTINYNKVHLILTTHAAKGLTENDFILAAKINALSS